ncbi:MAG: NADPH-dependent 7-cyano-7-deazaguanine reductase QueF [Marinilabiliales bacterium]|nr:MAG: NADPH-dependent 7-cyano-7-deazaguanine reductase QueF [Marinilabiliales bacterium]
MEQELTHLGNQSGYPQEYAPDVLEAIPRSLNREQYHIDEETPGFLGFDIWHAWEVSFITQKGMPVSGVLKIIYPQSSPFIVESKSLKLYLNSFNMTRLGKNRKEGISLLLQTVQNDLDRVLESLPTVSFFDYSDEKENDFSSWEILEEKYDLNDINFEDYNENPALLESDKESSEFRIGSNLLRSNCRVTFQPDWGSVFIHFKGKEGPTPQSLIKYIVSFRNENHFHEEVCEMIYKRLWDAYNPEELLVACLYTRRGGIDISPVRTNKISLLPEVILNPRVLGRKLLRG